MTPREQEENATSAALGPAIRIVLETPDTHVPPYVVEPEGAIDTPAPDSDSPSGASSGVSGAVSAAFERVEGPDKTTYTVEEFYAVLARSPWPDYLWESSPFGPWTGKTALEG